MVTCKSILVVEDDDDIRTAISEVLEMEGYTVASARNGHEGLELLKHVETPCLVLLDLMMPVMNGQEFLHVKKDDLRIAPIPVVIVSAVADRNKVAGPGVSGFIKKPIHLDTLLGVVEQYCGAP